MKKNPLSFDQVMKDRKRAKAREGKVRRIPAPPKFTHERLPITDKISTWNKVKALFKK